MFGPLLDASGANRFTASLAIGSGTSTGLDVRNNAFANSMTGGMTPSAHVAVSLPSGSASMSLTWNNNVYFTGSTSGVHGIAQVGVTYFAVPPSPTTFGGGLYTAVFFDSSSTTDVANFRSYTSTLGNVSNDGASFATIAAPPFTSNTDVHVPAAAVTQLESNGAPLGVATDIDGQSRNAATPDIGADEFAGVVYDLTPPSIQYTPLGNILTTENRILVTNITDARTGVPTSGAGRPVIYFRKGVSGTYAGKACVHGGGSTYNCEIDYTLVSGGTVALGDTIQYYVAAQDEASTPNVGVRPPAGAGGLTSNPPAASTPPSPPSSYAVMARISGTYRVGTTETHKSLTNPDGIFEFLNNSALNGNVTVEITSDLTAETGTHALNQWVEEGIGGYTLTIKPVGSARVVSGTTTSGLIKLNGADRVTIDGSLATPSGTDRSLTVQKLSTSGAVIWIASAGATNGATNNVVKNCGVTGSGTIPTVSNVRRHRLRFRCELPERGGGPEFEQPGLEQRDFGRSKSRCHKRCDGDTRSGLGGVR
jgi:hypothetical protein